ncbi:MAG: hypothetical protein FWC36_09000 [Spirochaetes bacterium]|nr:hypothetical protein [Spirochaetota bacterium]
MNKNVIFFYFSLLLAIISIIVHGSTYFLNEYYGAYSLVFIIHILIFIPFAIMVLQRKNNFTNISIKSKNPYLSILRILIPNGNNFIYAIIGIVFLYAFINFFATLFLHVINGVPEIIDGKYVLNRKGEITEITQAEYFMQKFHVLRLYSGHWILFSIIPMIYFYFNKKRNF